jgi:hypothetical protein
MHALIIAALVAAAPPKATPQKRDPGAAVKPFSVKVVNDHVEAAFTVTYSVTYADGRKPAKGTLAKGLHIKAHSSAKLDGNVPAAHEKDEVHITIATTTPGDTEPWDIAFTMKKTKLRTFIITYSYDTAAAKVRVKAQ